MIRPFKLEHIKISGINFKNKIYGTHHAINHRGQTIGRGIVTNKKFWKKLLSHPITAFAYDFPYHNEVDINPKFDRHDVIRALDFWIEYWVYQNKCDYILEGTLNEDFEFTVRELIELREAVLKLPADTKFTRKKIRKEDGKDGRDFNFQRKDKYYRLSNNKIETNMSERDIRIAEEHVGKFPKEQPLFQPAKDQIVEFTENIISSPSSSVIDQFCYMVKTMTYKEYMKDKGTVTKKSGVLRLSGTEPAHPNWDIISVPIEARSITVQNDEEEDIHYPNMHLSVEGGGIWSDVGSNAFTTIPLILSGLGETQINVTIIDTGNNIDALDTWRGIDTRLILRENDAIIRLNDQDFHFAQLNIRHDPRQPHNMIYRDLWIESVNVTAARRSTLNINFLNGTTPNSLIRSNISLIIEFTEGSTDGALMHQSINNDEQRAWDLEILGNNRVRIGGDEYTVLEPIDISFGR